MKYIILIAPGGETPVLFPRSFMHRYVAGLFAPMSVVSAGFVGLKGNQIQCYGRSDGLNLSSRPDRDSAIVRRSLPSETGLSIDSAMNGD